MFGSASRAQTTPALHSAPAVGRQQGQQGQQGHGVGAPLGGRRQRADHFRYYFTPSPAELLFDHLPREAFWRLVDQRLPGAGLSHAEWDRLPLVKPAYWAAGLAPVPAAAAAAAGEEEEEEVVELCSDVGAEGWWSASAAWLGGLFGTKGRYW